MPAWLLPLLAAPFVGSFLGVLVRRLPAGRPVALARSRCEACGHALGAAELVPLASYLVQRGRCRACGARIAPAHPTIELAALLPVAWAALVQPDAAWLWADCVLGWSLLALCWIDWVHFRLPDALSLPLLLAGLAATAWLDPDALSGHAAAAAIGYGAIRLLAVVYRRLRQREGIGLGDAKLLAAGGAWVGLAGLPGVVLAAALGGIALVLAQATRGVRPHAASMVPFGSCLALAIWLVRLYGPLF